MFRLLKALPLTLAIAALSLFIGCSSGNNAQIRVINAIPDAEGALDVDVNGNKITGSTPVAFGSIFPNSTSSATYASEPSGSDTITAYVSGTTVNPVNNGTTTFSASAQYTVVLQGNAASNNTPAVLTDNNTAPSTNTLEYRVIYSSPWLSRNVGPVDVYIIPTGNQLPASPNISGLTFGQAIYVQSLPYTSGNGYTVVVTPRQTPNDAITTQNYNPANGSITTLVLVDQSGGTAFDPFPLAFSDLN
jgi:hypothetical protein